MAQKTISSSGSSWTGTASADQAYISYADRVRLNTGGGNDSIFNYYGWYETIDAGDGNDTVKSYRGKDSSIVGGAGNDLISLSGASVKVTLAGGKGNDTIYGDTAAQLFQYASGDGNDVIYNWSTNDTISITGGTYTRSIVGNDVVLKVGSGAVTLKGAKGKTVNVKGTVESGGFNNIASGKTLNGTSGNDSITNNYEANRVTINGNAGNDSISNYGWNVSINGGAGNDYIYSYDVYNTILGGAGNDTIENYGGNVKIDGGNGNDSISNSGWNVSINSGAGNDYILNTKVQNVTINGGAGNDTVSLDSSSDYNVIQYASGDGNDVIYNWSAHDTISITGGTYTRSTVGNDVVLKVGNGAITLKGAKNTTVNVKGTIEGYTANGTANKTVGGTSNNDTILNYADSVKVDVGAGNDSISNSGDNVTIIGGAGNDHIDNYGSNVKIDGGAGNDSIYGYKAKNSSINGGAGNDTVSLDSSGGNRTFIQYANGDGNDVIYNWSSNDTISITDGTYTLSTVGNDVVLKVGSGAVTLKGAKNTTVNVRGELYDEDDDIIIKDTVYWASFNNSTSNKTVNGTSRNDSITNNYGANYVTINAGKGNDTLYFGGGKNLISYASGDGSDVVYNLGSTDTISITGGSYTRSTVGSDVVLKVGSGAITVKGGKNSTVNVKGTLAGGGNSTTPATQPSGNVLYGTNGHDSIKNSTAGKVIYALDGNDTVRNSANNVYISGGAGNDSIESYSYAANVTIDGGDGNDNIDSSGANAKIYCGNGNDSVDVVRGDNDYIDGGAGDDTLDVWSGKNLSLKGGAGNDYMRLYSNASCVIAYNSGDGYDTVTGFDGNDTLKVYGSYTRSTVGNDVVVKVGYGSITLKNAKNSTLNISNLSSSADLVSSADLASDDWISADDNNFVMNDTRLDSIVETTATDHSVGKLDTATTSLTPRNIFVAFTGKK